jgi:hypothetical protein
MAVRVQAYPKWLQVRCRRHAARWTPKFIVLLIGLAGCVQVPVQPLNDYVSSFEEARSAGLLLIDEVAKSSAAIERRRAGPTAAASRAVIPETFDPEAVTEEGADGVPALFAARRAAFDAIMDFNEVLIKLAEGRSVEEMRTDVAEIGRAMPLLLSLAQTAVPGAGIVLTALGPALRQAEVARSRLEFRRAVIAGEDDVQNVIALLIRDTPALYDIQKNRYKLERDGALAAAGQVRRSMIAVASAYQAPSGADAAERNRLASEAGAILSRLLDQPVAVTLAASSSPAAPGYPAEANRQLAVFVTQLREVQAQALAAEQGKAAAYEAMRRYVLLLRKTQNSLTLLGQEVEAPSPVTAGDLLRVGTDVREHAVRLKGAVRQL